MLPISTSGRVPGWLAAVPHSTIDAKADAQTIAQAIETGHVTVISDVQEYDETTQSIRAIGNATFAYPESELLANANEIQYTATARQVTLLGNVQISQQGETLRGAQAICSLEQRQCHLTQE
jgi:lipopolysaccharide export system protein LptA